MNPEDRELTRDDAIVVALSADAQFRRQLAVVLAGLSRWSADLAYEVFVLHDGFDAPLMSRIEAGTNDRVRVHWIDARSPSLHDAQIPNQDSHATLFRLLMPRLLPEHVDRVIYLDADVVVRQPLTELWRLDIGDALVGAVRDAFVPWAAAPLGLPWRRLDLPPDLPYFNSGTLVVPLDRWRAEQVGERALSLLAEHELLYGDQCALNVVVAGRWAQLEPRWNVQGAHLHGSSALAWISEPQRALDDAIASPAIVHFNRDLLRRPWTPYSTHPYRAEWFEYLDQTNWVGWRPPVPGFTKRVARRILRAGRTLFARPSVPLAKPDRHRRA